LHGDGNIDIVGVCSLDNPKVNSICYIGTNYAKFSKLKEKVGAVLVHESILNLIPDNNNILVTIRDVDIFSNLTFLFKSKESTSIKVDSHDTSIPSLKHSGYIAGDNCSIGFNCKFGHNVVIEDNVKIGNNCSIGHNVVIHQNCIIGSNVFIDSSSTIGSEGFGNVRNKDKKWCHIHHLGSVIIHDNVQIGSNCNIDRGTIDNTIIQKGVILDNLIHIAHNTIIGEDTAIAAKTGIAGSCRIGKRNMIGGMVGIVDHITTADDVTISATSTVHKNLLESGVYSGIMPISKHSVWKRIALLITKLDKMYKVFNKQIKS